MIVVNGKKYARNNDEIPQELGTSPSLRSLEPLRSTLYVNRPPERIRRHSKVRTMANTYTAQIAALEQAIALINPTLSGGLRYTLLVGAEDITLSLRQSIPQPDDYDSDEEYAAAERAADKAWPGGGQWPGVDALRVAFPDIVDHFTDSGLDYVAGNGCRTIEHSEYLTLNIRSDEE